MLKEVIDSAVWLRWHWGGNCGENELAGMGDCPFCSSGGCYCGHEHAEHSGTFPNGSCSSPHCGCKGLHITAF